MADAEAEVQPEVLPEPGVVAVPPEPELEPGPTQLPWGVEKERSQFPEGIRVSTSARPGEFILQTLFAEFCVLAEKKIITVLEGSESQKPLSKVLQRGEDPCFDQLLSSLGNVAEHSLPSLLQVLFDWYDKQSLSEDCLSQEARLRYRSKSEKEIAIDSKNARLMERREFAVNFIYCLVLIEVLKQLPYHPGYDDLIHTIIQQAFKHFRRRDGGQPGAESANSNIIADLYAEVLGVLAHSRLSWVKKLFMTELKELRQKEQTPSTTNTIISLLMGMKFFRVKMHPIEEFQASIQFLQECGHYFLEVKDRDIKHALAGLFVEILLPVGAVVKNEVNVPVLKNFVENMYNATLDISNKKKHNLALFPMVTCLLCVSQKTFFLNNWPYFLTVILSHLKDRDPKMCRVALESLYRLVWVYMVRIKCESNTATTSRLQSIVSSLFPKGNKGCVPRDAPLNIFVKIIQFVAQERLDFAMREIIFDLLCVGRPIKNLTPERMSIGLRAFLVVADSLQQKEGDPPMPQTMGVMPSGNTLRFKKTFINKYLSDAQAKHIGMALYYPHVRKAFNSILHQLDVQVGKPLMRTRSECLNREPEEIITLERMPKIELFRTCVAAVPRLLPDGMTQFELIDLLSRLSIHIDDELGKLAFQSLQNMIVDLPSWRNEVLRGFVLFIQKEVTDPFHQLLDQCSRRLISLLTQWRTCGYVKEKPAEEGSKKFNLQRQERQRQKTTLHDVEGFALVMLCSAKPFVRKLAGVILKEVRNLFNMLELPQDVEPCVLDVMDRSCPVIIEKFLPHLPATEKAAALSAPSLDFQWLADRTSIIWTSTGFHDLGDSNTPSDEESSRGWIECMAIFMHRDYVMGHCPTAVASAWPILYCRMNALFKEHLDPTNTQNERTSSILGRPGSKKVTNERDLYLSLWQNYIVMGSCIAPSSQACEHRSSSPDPGNHSPDSYPSEGAPRSPGAAANAKDLFKHLVPLIRCELTDMMEAAVTALGYINPEAFRDLVDELLPIIKEAIDRKQENVRRRKRRDIIRLSLVKIFRYMAEHGIFAQSPCGVIGDNNALSSTFVEYIEGARMFLENEGEKDLPVLQEIRLNYSEFIRNLIRNTQVARRGSLLSRELRYSLFYLFARWSGKFGQTFGAMDRRGPRDERCSELELSAVQAMSAVLCCGPVFDPTGLNDDGYIYQWLDTLLKALDDKIYKLSQETVVLLLEFNPDVQSLLEWVIDRCYTGKHEVTDGCFNALAVVFNNREYPCDHVAMLNVTLLNTGCPRVAIHETAVQLLHLLYKRFFLDNVIVTDSDTSMEREEDGGEMDYRETVQKLQELLLSGPYSRSQIFISEMLARLHPDLTMPMFSEITQRFQTAKSAIRQTLLQYLLPWLHNLELVDPNLPQGSAVNTLQKLPDDHSDYMSPPLKGEGWGSPQATEMVLNNLLYITAKFGDDHAKEIEDLWAALVACRPNNLKVIIRYIVIITGTAPVSLLPYTKRIVVYLGRAKPERLVEEMMVELHTVEALTFNVERTQTPPYYRFTKKPSNAADDPPPAPPPTAPPTPAYTTQLVLDKGQLSTKRISADDPLARALAAGADDTARTNSTTSVRSETSTVSSLAQSIKTESEMEELMAVPKATVPGVGESHHRPATPIPYPLPMPAYGGYFAPIYELLPAGELPNPPYQRCNLAVMLLSDLIVDGVLIDWTAHLPLMLHIIFLGLDHSRSLIHEHCKKLLLNLLLVMAAHNDHFDVAKIILSNRAINEDTALTLPQCGPRDRELRDTSFGESMEGSGEGGSMMQSVISPGNLATDSVSSLVDVDLLNSTEEVAKALIEFLVTRKNRPLWSYEDITAKVQHIGSADQLEHFLKYVVRVFRESVPLAHIEQRWAQMALQLALSCPSRHYAGRSFQIFRALRVSLNSQMLSDILPRLVDTVADPGEDMQGYVTEIMLTLMAAVDGINEDFRPMDFVKELFLSTPNLNKEPRLEIRKSATVALRQNPPHHYRSTSYSLSALTGRKAVVSGPPNMTDVKGLIMAAAQVQEPRHRSQSGDDARKSTNLSRSRSAQSLKASQDAQGPEDRLSLLLQMFWISVSLLESDYEYEFLLAVGFLDKLLQHIQPDRPECCERLDKILQQIKWYNFPGVQALLLKGCTSPATGEATWRLLSKLTLCMNAPTVDPSQGAGFPINVISLLPYLVEHYEEPSQMCTEAANHISQMCMEQSQKLDNLATVMQLYSRGTFGKDKFQWTKCVIKYLFDVYANLGNQMIAFLVEVLEKGPSSIQGSVLEILHCIVHYIDVTAAPFHLLNGEMLRIVAKYVESCKWGEALKILKFCVTRSSSLTVPPTSMTSSTYNEMSLTSLSGHTSFAEADVSFKKELPGRTMDFTFDISQIGLIGQKRPDTSGEDSSEKDTASNAPSTSTIEPQGPPGWKTPQLAQKRTRERLVNLLNVFGQSGQIGLRQSSSDTVINKVIFSQSSDTIERQASKSTSSEEMSQTEGIPGDDSSMERQLRVFDFLDELDNVDDDNQFNQGLLHRGSSEDDTDYKDLPSSSPNVSDEDDQSSVSPIEDYPCPATSSTVTLQNAGIAETQRRHSTSSTTSLQSEHSDADISDISPSSASPSFSNMAVVSIQSDEIDEVWSSHVHRVMTDDSATYAINTFHLFARLFQETQRKLQTITKEACYFLSRNDKVKTLAAQLSAMLDLLNNSVECPLVYADMETLVASHLVERLKFSILEINENYETYLMRKNHAMQVLEGLKSSVKLQSLGEELSHYSGEEQVELSMSWALYHLHFQFLQLFESYSKLVSCVAHAHKPPEIADLSRPVMELKEALQLAQLEMDLDQEDSFPPAPDEALGREGAERLLMDCLQNRQMTNAVHLMRHLRKLFPGDMFGVNPSDEVEGLLFIFCKCQAEAKPGVVAVTRADHDHAEVHARLIEIKIQLTHTPTSQLPTPLVSSPIIDPNIAIDQTSSMISESPTSVATDSGDSLVARLGLQCTTTIKVETIENETVNDPPESSTL